jgi:hypothetical protein
MAQPTPKVIRCGIPDCDWGTPFSVLGEEIEDCRRQYRKHYHSDVLAQQRLPSLRPRLVPPSRDF